MRNIAVKDIPIEEAEYCVFDFETTGTSPRFSRVIEIGIVKIKNLKIVDTYQRFIHPGMQIPKFITDLTGITNADIENAPFFDEIIDEIIDFFGESILVAHNIRFDHSFLKSEFRAAGYDVIENPAVCTLNLARKLYPDLRSKSLSSLTKHFKIRHRNVHRGLGDATVTAKLLLKMLKALKEEHDIETVSDLLTSQSIPQTKPQFRIIKKKLSEDLLNIPESPGVYFFKDSSDKIIYIGKSKSLKQRIKNYFSNTAPKKSKRIVRKASRLGYSITYSELTALLLEAELIKIHRPHFNTLLKKYPTQYFIQIGLTEEYPTLSLSSKFDFDGNDYFGPYNSRETANTLIDIIDKTFQLRECSPKEFKKQRKCYLADIQRCYAPCIDKTQQANYREELIKAYDFLSGQNQFALDRLLNRMKLLSEKKKYEEAAEIRDTINSILNSINRLSILAEPINKSNVLIEVNQFETKDFLLLLKGNVFIKNNITGEKNYFEEALEDYFSGTIHLYKGCREKDLEHIKIILSWLIKNRNNVKIHYLKNYESKEEVYLNSGIPKRKPIKS
ncbi:MAG: hypothetical protein A2V66_04655 [Ignavibacteria bacterium RBG_13_36_8]|nr:MAG: hypothetical protein A2V66_04655 [Ignavibacteria bacterium RBG_13_36_8]